MTIVLRQFPALRHILDVIIVRNACRVLFLLRNYIVLSRYRYMSIINISHETRKITSTGLLSTMLLGLSYRYFMTHRISWNEIWSDLLDTQDIITLCQISNGFQFRIKKASRDSEKVLRNTFQVFPFLFEWVSEEKTGRLFY